ncbi:MAG: hypothetical protein ACI86M_001085 [Saprospiraceae bacterium]
MIAIIRMGYLRPINSSKYLDSIDFSFSFSSTPTILKIQIHLKASSLGQEDYLPSLFNIINAPITPGTQAHNVRRRTIMIDPQPLS